MATGSGTELHEIISAIGDYARAYSQLERLQAKCDEYLPLGDQKTGVIAEFYARLYAQRVYPKATAVYGTTSEKGWDIKLKVSSKSDVCVQVKAVSGHSKTSRISPIHMGWDKLWLLRLDKSLMPIGFWTVEAKEVEWAKYTKSNLTMPKTGSSGSGSAEFANAVNRTEDFLRAMRGVLGPEWSGLGHTRAEH